MTYLNYDADGFIVGVNRMNDGIDKVHNDTQEIIQVLKSQNQIGNTRMKELTRTVKSASNHAAIQANNDRTRTSQDRRASTRTDNQGPITDQGRITRRAPTRRQAADNNSNSTGNRSTGPNPNPNPSTDQSSDAAARITRNSTNASDRARPNPASGANDDASRERDANGRFTGGASKSRLGSGIDAMGRGLNGLGQNTSGVDPVLDSLKEAKDLLSPIGRMGKLAGRGVKFSWSKMKALKRREPLPIDQDRHNNENEKLLDKIWKAIKKTGGGSGGTGDGLLGNLLGGGGGGRRNRRRGRRGRLGRIAGALGRKLPYIGAAIGAGSLAMDWDSLNHKEKSEGVGSVAGGTGGAIAGAAAGAAVGSVVPVLGTAIGGLIGGGLGYWLGSEGGEVISGAASPYIESWTKTLIGYNLPDKMSDTWNDGIKPFFQRMDALAGKLDSWIESKANDFGDTVSSTGAGLSEMLGIADLGSVAEKYESGGRGFDTVSTGKGDHGGVSYGTHQLSSKTGSMAAYLKSPEGRQFAGEFAGMSASSQAFKNKYKDVANRRGDEFKKSQKDYITRTHYMPAKQNAEKYGFDTKNRGIQEAIYSHGTQYGPNHESRFKRVAASGVDMKDNQAVLKAFYADKARNVNTDFPSSSASVRAGIAKNRIPSELADVLAISKVSDVKNTIKAAVTPKQPDSKEVEGSVASKAKNNNSALGVNIGGMTPNVPAPATITSSTPLAQQSPLIFKSAPSGGNIGYAPANLPAAPTLNIPKMDVPKQRLDSGGSNKPVMMQSSNDTITQNVSDRGLAHAITGGLGQDRYWG